MRFQTFIFLLTGLALVVVNISCSSTQMGNQALDEQHKSSKASGLVHKHDESTDFTDQLKPDGQLAPRLQNLGVHIFPVNT